MLGNAHLDKPIVGMKAKVDFGYSAPESLRDHFQIGVGGRRLEQPVEQQSGEGWTDFCAGVWTDSRVEVANSLAQIGNEGGEDSSLASKVLEKYRGKVERYGEDYCAPF